MKAVIGVAIVLLTVATGSSCGYSLAGRGSFLPASIRVVGIPMLENRTTIPRVEQLMTDKVRTEFISRGKYTVVPTTAGADAVLSGAILSILIQPVGFTEQQLASRQLFTVTMRVQFTDARTSEVLWSNEALTFREEYEMQTAGNGDVDSTVLLEQEAPAFERLSVDLARSVVSAILEAF